MKPEELKAKSRGISRDMSPEAISRRFDILVELDTLARALEKAKRQGRVAETEAPYKATRTGGRHGLPEGRKA
jgi:hypothetical protein